jgi:hypothetical protein
MEAEGFERPRVLDLLEVIPLSVPSPDSRGSSSIRIDHPQPSERAHRRVESPEDGLRPVLHPVRQQLEELLIMIPNDEIEARILNLIIDIRTQLQLQIGQNTTRLNALEIATAAFVDKDYIAKFFAKMRATLNEMSEHVSLLKQTMRERVTKTELPDAIKDVFRSLKQGQETSGGTTSYQYLLCGREKRGITGMISDSRVAKALGDPPEAIAGLRRATSVPRGTMLYGTDKQLYRGRGNFGRPAVASALESRRPLPGLDMK